MTPAPSIYETTYAHDRRRHRHRCQCCRRIIEAGETVVMWKVDHKTTRALHEACAHRGHGELITAIDNLTDRDAIDAWLDAALDIGIDPL